MTFQFPITRNVIAVAAIAHQLKAVKKKLADAAKKSAVAKLLLSKTIGQFFVLDD